VTEAAAAGPKGRSSSSAVVRDIVRGLHDGRYVPGQRLVEPDLMKRYGVSRSTVREALQRLAAEGVVDTSPFRGAQIRHPTRSEAEDTLSVLEVLIGLAARQAAERINLTGRKDLFEQAYYELVSTEGAIDLLDQIRARNRFYRAMSLTSGNLALSRLLPQLQVHLVRSYQRQDSSERFRDYKAIAAAILAGSPGKAEQAARDHITKISSDLARLPDELFARQPDGPPSPEEHITRKQSGSR
jgi:DNA-binding GntR family transcriptional regulator